MGSTVSLLTAVQLLVSNIRTFERSPFGPSLYQSQNTRIRICTRSMERQRTEYFPLYGHMDLGYLD